MRADATTYTKVEGLHLACYTCQTVVCPECKGFGWTKEHPLRIYKNSEDVPLLPQGGCPTCKGRSFIIESELAFMPLKCR